MRKEQVQDDNRLRYWQQQVGESLPVLQLPTDRPRLAVVIFHGARQSVVLPKALTEALKTLSQQEGVTLFMTLLAAFQTLLHRYTGQEDIVVGSPIEGHTQEETEGLTRLLMNTLILRTNLASDLTFRELLRRVREVTLRAYERQDLPFEASGEELHQERDCNYSPLFQVLFALQNVPPHFLELPGLTLQPLVVASETATFEVSLFLWEGGEGLQGAVEYNAGLFEVATIARMFGHYQTVLEGIVANPEARIATLPLLTAAERRQLLVEWNATQREYPQAQSLPQLFEAQVERTPDAIALVFEEQQVTYQELNGRANQLAHYLQGLGVGAETLVGLCLDRSIEMVVGLLGIIKAGGTYVPLDPSYPAERLAFLLRDAQLPVLLTRYSVLDRLPTYIARVVCVDTNWPTIAQVSTATPTSGVHAESAAYVIYTSGSTGMPKGVLGLHQGVVNRAHWMWEQYPFEPSEVCCQKTSLNFVDSVWEIFGPLLQGTPTVIIPDEAIQDPQRLVRHLAAAHVTRIVLVPSLLQAVLETDQDLQSRLPKLRLWISSGEALSHELAQRFWDQMPQSILLNLYGSSEVAADATWYETNQGKTLPSVPIGRPIANTQVYILDTHLQLVPIGVPGELCIGGAGLARGYLNRPALTAEKFIPHPFSTEPGARLYKTGDLARYRSDGNLEFLGRLDHQVKVRGFRIEVGEIEATLTQHPAVREAVVTVREDTPGDKRLVAYVVRAPEQSFSPSELRRFLQTKLPEYMAPAIFLVLDVLPLTPNGKVDRRALPAPGHTRPELESELVAPRTPVEEVVAEIWAEVLRIERVGIHDNFFALGGHSLLATQVIARIRRTLHLDLPLRTLFEMPTVADLAVRITETQVRGVAQDKDGPPVDRVRGIVG